MCLSDDPLSEDEEDVVKEFVKEVVGVYHYGMRKSNPEIIKKGWPQLFNFLQNDYGDFINSCVFVIQKRDKLSEPVPFILVPNKNMTVVTWDKNSNSHKFVESEDFARSIERFKQK